MTLSYIVGTILLTFICAELLAWSAKLTDWLLQKSTRQLPSLELQERMLEEWRSAISDRPGKLSKLWFAMDTFRASYRIAHFYRTPHINLLRGFSIRAYDFFVSSMMVFFAWPILATIAIAVKLDDKGPIMFKVKRVGRDGKIIYLYTFRWFSLSGCGPASTKITRVGNFIRKTRLDVLPQLFNVVFGDVSLVGPRPIREEEYNKNISKIENYSERFTVRPGITGLAQISSPYRRDVKNELKHDLSYIKQCSFLLNLRILFRTASIVIRGKR